MFNQLQQELKLKLKKISKFNIKVEKINLFLVVKYNSCGVSVITNLHFLNFCVLLEKEGQFKLS